MAMRHNLFLSLIVVLTVLLSACIPRKEPLNIGGNSWLGYQPFYIAQQLDICVDCPYRDEYIGDRPVRMRPLPSTTMVLRLFQAGELDGVLVTLDEALSLNQLAAKPLCVAQILSYSNGADALVAEHGVDLNNDSIRVGYEQTALGAYMLERVKQMLSLTESQIKPVYVTPNFHLQALANNEVDAVITYEPYLSQLLAGGAEVRFSSAQIPGEIIDLLVVTQDAFFGHEPVFDWLSGAYWAFGLDLLNARNDETDQFVMNAVGLSKEELMHSLAGIHFVDPRRENSETIDFAAAKAKVSEALNISNQRALPLCTEVVGR